jgi:hypothetical protein
MSNPTSNYSFQMPTNTDLVYQLPADFEVFGQAVDTQLKALNPSTTLGDIEYRSSTANTNTRLGIGSTGQVLTVSGGVPAWAAPAGGGKVLQVVYASTTTLTTVASTTLTDTTLTATITPTSATSKILVIANLQGFSTRSSNYVGTKSRLLRGATTILDYPDDSFTTITATGATLVQLLGVFPMTTLDSPATTSATTYKVQGAVQLTANSASITYQYGGGPSTITLIEIGA